jgi:aminomuconate-semialdehyde/2-hydroxymuconate-6-semialdehyde dehydrogenase
MIKIDNFINGEFYPCGEYLQGQNPASEAAFYQVANSSAIDVDSAIEAAEKSFYEWSTLDVEKRAEYLLALAKLIDENANHLAKLESLDTGKPLSLAKRVDIPRSAENFRFFAHAITQFASLSHPTPSSLNYTLKQPLGIVGCISPWNLPLYLLTWKIAPALAAGNCVIAKPSEMTPLTANELAHLSIEAGLPKGVLNIIHGKGSQCGEYLVGHSKIKAISFTGGTDTGKKIASRLAPMLTKYSLELGGKNAAVIFADCDYLSMLETTVRSSFTNQGEICLCTSRIFIEKTLYQQFITDFVEKVRALRIGKPLDDNTQVGALISKQHLQKVSHFVEKAMHNGGRVLCGGKAFNLEGKGYYYMPTVIEGLDAYDEVNQTEIFGPVVSIIPFEKEHEVITHVNSTTYGLATSLWTENLSRAHRLSAQIESGLVWVNCWMQRDLRTPFGGMKDSGMGREGGFDALDFFTEKKNICINFQ